MSSRFDELLTDQQLEDATTDEIDDLVDRIDKMLQSRGSKESCVVSPMVYSSRPIPQIRTRPSKGMLPVECRRTGEARSWPGTCLRGGTGSE